MSRHSDTCSSWHHLVYRTDRAPHFGKQHTRACPDALRKTKCAVIETEGARLAVHADFRFRGTPLSHSSTLILSQVGSVLVHRPSVAQGRYPIEVYMARTDSVSCGHRARRVRCNPAPQDNMLNRGITL